MYVCVCVLDVCEKMAKALYHHRLSCFVVDRTEVLSTIAIRSITILAVV